MDAFFRASVKGYICSGSRERHPISDMERYPVITIDDIIRACRYFRWRSAGQSEFFCMLWRSCLPSLSRPPSSMAGLSCSPDACSHHALDRGHANALKHAEAAATLYSWLRFVGIREQASEQIVVRLGIVNEYVELYVKRGRKDTTLEMMRDLHSNMVGITVARWRESPAAPDYRSRSERLVALAKSGVLLRSEDDVGLSPEEKPRAKQSADLDWATSWLERNKVAIEQQAMQALQDTRR